MKVLVYICPNTARFDYERMVQASCFDGRYITGDVSTELLDQLETTRRQQAEVA